MSEANDAKKLLDPSQVISAPDREYVTVDVPRWGGPVRLGSTNASEFVTWMSSDQAFSGLRLVCHCWVDADGNRIGVIPEGQPNAGHPKPELLESLKNKDSISTGLVVGAAMRLNGLAAEQVRDRKNEFGEAPQGASPSDTPASSAATTSSGS